MVAMLDWDEMAALEAAPGSGIGQRAADDVAANLVSYATFRGMIFAARRGLITDAGRRPLVDQLRGVGTHLAHWRRPKLPT